MLRRACVRAHSDRCRCDACPIERDRGGSHPHRGAKDRHAGLGARRHQSPRPRPAGRSRHRDHRACQHRGRQDRARKRLRRSDPVGLAVGRARTRARRRRWSSIPIRARSAPSWCRPIRRSGASPISRAKSSRLPADRSTRAGCCSRRWRAAPASISNRRRDVVYGAPPLLPQKALQGETDATLTFWNFCAELEAQGLAARRRHGRRDEGPRRQRTGRHRRLCVRRQLGRDATVRCCDRFLAATRQAKDILAESPRRVAAARAAHRRDRRGRARDLSPALSRRHSAPAARRRKSPTRRALYDVLAEIGGADLVGPARELDPGTFYTAGPSE